MEERELYRSNESFLISQICRMLQENNIRYIRKSDSYRKIDFGSDCIETKIFVSSEDYEQASLLLEMFNSPNIEYVNGEIPEELKDIVDDEEMEKDIKKYRNMKKILYFWIPAVMVSIIIILCAISNRI